MASLAPLGQLVGRAHLPHLDPERELALLERRSSVPSPASVALVRNSVSGSERFLQLHRSGLRQEVKALESIEIPLIGSLLGVQL